MHTKVGESVQSNLFMYQHSNKNIKVTGVETEK